MITMHARPRQTDRQTDEHHGNSNGTGVHCDHVHVSADIIYIYGWIVQCSGHPTPNRLFQFHLEERWVWMCKLGVISQEG